MISVRDLLRRKAAKIVVIDAMCTVYQALLKLDDHRIGALIVADEEGAIAGIITERDILKGAKLFGENFIHRPVRDLMTKKLINCDITDSVVDAMKMMGRKFRHLPVIDRGEVVGIISIRDSLTASVELLDMRDDTVLRQVTER